MFSRLIKPQMGNIHPQYMKFVKWSMLSNVIVSFETAISTHNMLASLNGGENTHVTINYIGKDIIGQLGSLYYINKVSQTIDKNPYNIVQKCNIMQQFSYMCICTAPFIDTLWFLPITGLANILVNLSFTGFGAVNAICIKKLSNDNIGEIYSKLTIVNTMSSSIGLCIGVAFNTMINDPMINCIMIPISGIMRVITLNKSLDALNIHKGIKTKI